MIKKLKRKIVTFTVVVIGVVVAVFAAIMSGLAIARTKSEFSRSLEMAVSRLAPGHSVEIGKGDDMFSSAAICVIEYNAATDSVVTLTSDAYIDEDTAKAVIVYVLSSSKKNGVIDDLNLAYYSEKSPVSIKIAVADNSYITERTMSILLFAFGGTVAVVAVVFLISLYVSSVAVKPVENAMEDQKRFIADASHELKTPLSVIAANNKILAKSAKPDQEEWIASNDYEIRHMTDIIKDMLTLAQGESGGTVEKKTIDASKIADSVLLQFDAVAYEKNVKLEGDVISGIVINGNEKMIARLFMILIDNAIKYEPGGGDVSVKFVESANKAVFSVNNRGSVIADEDLPHIFDRFYRSEKSRTSNGVGLGLAIAKNIVELHNGNIKAFSSDKDGTTFRAELPTK